jgi:hypothetical protein
VTFTTAVENQCHQPDSKRRVGDDTKCRRDVPTDSHWLPADRWSKGDLGTLKGCWMLGSDVPMLHTFADGRKEQVTIKAGRLCFDNQGSGLHEQITIGPSGWWICKAPMTAKFWRNGTLAAQQPIVLCEGESPTKWAATQLTCRRVTDEMARCQAVDKSGRSELELRREP